MTGQEATHDCPDAANLRPGHDDLCDLPEPFRRLAYVGNYVPGDHSWVHDRCPGTFCPHVVFSEVVAAFRAVTRPDSCPDCGLVHRNIHRCGREDG